MAKGFNMGGMNRNQMIAQARKMQEQLIAARMSLEEIRAHIEADSVGFLSIEGLLDCVPPDGYCTACFTGSYPVEIPRAYWEERFLPGFEPDQIPV